MKDNIKQSIGTVHQMMTIIGLPVLIYLVGDMYKDFKDMRTKVIIHDDTIVEMKQDILRHEKKLDELDETIDSNTQEIFRLKYIQQTGGDK